MRLATSHAYDTSNKRISFFFEIGAQSIFKYNQKFLFFQHKANLHNVKISTEMFESMITKMKNEIKDKSVEIKQSDLYDKFRTMKQVALEEVCFHILSF